MRWLTAIPVYNEARHLHAVLHQVRLISPDILVVNDGSTDGTRELLSHETDLHLVEHPSNRGYGAAIASAFAYALAHDFDVLVTLDCDGQHEPHRIPCLLRSIDECDIASGSRYFHSFQADTDAPNDRRRINQIITTELNQLLGLNLTDAFCGFKAYRRKTLESLTVTESGWGMPLQVWVQAAFRGLRIREVAVPRIYLDPNRTFGSILNDAEKRLAYYRQVIAQEYALQAAQPFPPIAPAEAIVCPEGAE